MIVLGIETATDVLSIALLEDDKVLGEMNVYENKQHTKNIVLMIKNTLEICSINKNDIDLICVDEGPGSFTSLRIGVSTARALAQFTKKNIISMKSLDILMQNIYVNYLLQKYSEEYYIIPMLDARKNRIYTTIYQNDKRIEEYLDISPQKYIDQLISLKKKLILVGNGVLMYYNIWQDSLKEKMILIPHNFHQLNAVTLSQFGRKLYLNQGGIKYSQINPAYLRKSDAELSLE